MDPNPEIRILLGLVLLTPPSVPNRATDWIAEGEIGGDSSEFLGQRRTLSPDFHVLFNEYFQEDSSRFPEEPLPVRDKTVHRDTVKSEEPWLYHVPVHSLSIRVAFPKLV